MLDWYRRLTGLHLSDGGSLNDAVEKINRLPWWRSKTLFLKGNYVVTENLIIPSTIYLDGSGMITGCDMKE